MGILNTLFGGGDQGFDEARRANERNKALYDNLKLPEYSQFNPNQYNTESSQYQFTADDPVAKSNQASYLNKLSGLSDTGLSQADEAEFTKASTNANQIAKSGNAAVMNNAQARGVGGSGLEMLMREQENQNGAQRAQDAGMQTAAGGARGRELYSQAFGQEASNQRNQDYRTSQNNSNIINQFNHDNTQQRNQTNNANTALKNGAFQYNEGLKDKTYQNQLGKVDRQAGFNNRSAEIGSAEAASNGARGDALLNAGVNLGAAYLTGGASTLANKPKPRSQNTAGEPYDWSTNV